jgi:hypothetical protein
MYLFFKASGPNKGPTQPPTQWVTADFLLAINRPGRDADHSPSFSAEVKNNWSYNALVFQTNKF